MYHADVRFFGAKTGCRMRENYAVYTPFFCTSPWYIAFSRGPGPGGGKKRTPRRGGTVVLSIDEKQREKTREKHAFLHAFWAKQGNVEVGGKNMEKPHFEPKSGQKTAHAPFAHGLVHENTTVVCGSCSACCSWPCGCTCSSARSSSASLGRGSS